MFDAMVRTTKVFSYPCVYVELLDNVGDFVPTIGALMEKHHALSAYRAPGDRWLLFFPKMGNAMGAATEIFTWAREGSMDITRYEAGDEMPSELCWLSDNDDDEYDW